MGTPDALESLPLYYKLLFPTKYFVRWLSYGEPTEKDESETEPVADVIIDNKKSYFNRRELSFTLVGDIYLRYQSFKDDTELLKGLLSKVPIKIDIGAVFDKIPRDNRKTLDVLMPLERELIFDIDMDDYDDIRTCCKGPEICKNCWRFIVIAAKILNKALTDDFGFKNILWVYSGRRGIHGWVCDKRARRLTSEARSAIVDYLSIIEGGEFKSKRVTLPANKNLHPSITRALKFIEEEFVDFIIKDQKIFDTIQSATKIVELCTDPELKINLRNKVLKAPHRTGLERWNCFEKTIELHVKERNYTKTHARYFLDEIKLQLCYPRLDVNVSRGINHLLKAPFCVHPKTHRVCVPVDINNIKKFDPFNVPTIDELCSQIDAYDSSHPDEKDRKEDYLKTKLAHSIGLFRKFVIACEKDLKVGNSAEERLKDSVGF